MPPLFEELDYQPTAIGALSLRRRRELRTGEDVFEIKLGDQFLMSSLVTRSEVALADLAFAELEAEGVPEAGFDVLVGGLGLGHTARAALDHASLGRLVVVELLGPVIRWHETGLLPLGPGLVADPRCRFVEGDFFAMAESDEGFDPERPARLWHAILLDIDHSPESLLDPASAGFYTDHGLDALSRHLHPGGVFALWSNEPPDPGFTARLEAGFARARAEPVTFTTPLHEHPFIQTVYIARKG